MTAEKIKKTKQITTKKQELIMAIQASNPDFTQLEIAQQAGTSQSYVAEVLQKYNIIKKDLDDYKEHKINILQGLQQRIISSISDADIQKASLQQKVVGMGVIEDKLTDLQGRDKTTMPLVIINRIQVGKVEQSSYESGQESVIDV
jgi:hypothetical protein